MKIRDIKANNRKKAFVIETAKGKYEYPYSRLPEKLNADPVVSVEPEREAGKEAFTYVLKSGRSNTIHMDTVLEYNRDPDYLCELLLHNLTVCALDLMESQKLSKRELARHLKTSPRQLYRLLDPTYYGKTINQMIRLLHALGQTVEVVVKKSAA